ncbi:MAG TPA: hypothetical protein VMF58_13400 [Rhizomicrobium sp.]|nr:hypothetical protein [Rhizomicrobium sp.]
MFGKSFLAVIATAGFAALPLTSASAYPCNPVTGVFGAAATVAGAAVTIGTAPLVILSGHEPRFADYTCGDHPVYRNRGYSVVYEGPRGYDGPPDGYYAPPPPPAYYDRPHRPRWYWRHGYAPPPPPPPPPPG